jgi:hypothetical protein
MSTHQTPQLHIIDTATHQHINTKTQYHSHQHDNTIINTATRHTVINLASNMGEEGVRGEIHVC